MKKKRKSILAEEKNVWDNIAFQTEKHRFWRIKTSTFSPQRGTFVEQKREENPQTNKKTLRKHRCRPDFLLFQM